MHRFADEDLLMEAERRTVRIRAVNKEGGHHNKTSCGVIFQTGIVLSCEHVRSVDVDYLIDGKPATVLHKDQRRDLILMQTETEEFETLKFCFDYKRGYRAFFFGEFGSLKGFAYDASIGKIDSRGKIHTNAQYCPGASGCGLWHEGGFIGLCMERPNGIRVLTAVSSHAIGNWLMRIMHDLQLMPISPKTMQTRFKVPRRRHRLSASQPSLPYPLT